MSYAGSAVSDSLSVPIPPPASRGLGENTVCETKNLSGAWILQGLQPHFWAPRAGPSRTTKPQLDILIFSLFWMAYSARVVFPCQHKRLNIVQQLSRVRFQTYPGYLRL
jgi:hypothetical protein